MTGEHLWPAVGPALITAALTLMAGCGPTTPRDANPTTPAQAPAAGVDPRMASELSRAADRGAMCSGREAVAAGLRAEYFPRPEFQGEPMVARMEGPIDEPWPAASGGSPGPVRSARWRGWLKPPMSGRYAFQVDIPGARVQVANQWMVGAPAGAGPEGSAASSGSIELAAGRYAPILIELPVVPAEAAGRTVRLSWTAPHGATFLVPKAALFPPSDTVNDKAVTTAARTP